MLDERKPFDKEYRLDQRRNGGDVWVHGLGVLTLDEAGEPVRMFGTIQDITERKRAEVALRRTQRLESLGVLAGGIAHDFNNLLTGIFGFVELAEASSTEPEVQELLRTAGQPLDRARALTQQLLTFSKGGQPARKVAPLDAVLRNTARFAVSGANVTCRFDIPDDLRPSNHDEHQIAQVVDNIVINAVQAMPLGGTVTISARNVALVGHPTLPDGDYVCLSITDQGIGIPKRLLPNIFDPFFTTKQKGSGLGLATAFSIVRKHQGDIEVDSEPAKGSAFHVYLPAAPPAALSPSPAPAPASSLRGRGTALVMDDEATVRQVLSKMLGRMGYKCLCAVNGEEALALFSRQVADEMPAFAILDLTIAGGPGGEEVIKELRAAGAEMPIFAASGYSDAPVIARPAEFGFQGSLTKPFTLEGLSQLLSTLVDKE